MVWLWLLLPAVLLAGTLVLWGAVQALRNQRDALQAEVDALVPVGAQARRLRDPDGSRRATVGEEGDR